MSGLRLAICLPTETQIRGTHYCAPMDWQLPSLSGPCLAVWDPARLWTLSCPMHPSMAIQPAQGLGCRAKLEEQTGHQPQCYRKRFRKSQAPQSLGAVFSPQDVLGWEGYHPPSILWDTSSDQVLPLSAQLLTSWEPALLLHHKSSPAVPSQAEGKAEQPVALQQPNMAKAAGAFCILLLLTALCCQSLAQSKCGHLQDWEWEYQGEGRGAWGALLHARRPGWERGASRLSRALILPPGAPAVPDKCCFNFHTRRIKMDNIVACYATSPQCPHRAVV